MSKASEAIRGIAAFDLDGTLLRGDTVCEVLAKRLGRLEEMKRFEAFTAESDIADGRAQMVEWYRGCSAGDLEAQLDNATWAPGAHEAIRLLHEAGIAVGIASITWKFAVRWFAERIGICHFLGTDLDQNGEIQHVWGRDKARWLQDLADLHGISHDRIAAVGDSAGDAEMLRVAGLRFFVGPKLVPETGPVIHLPGADLRIVARRIIGDWAA
jgi:phosphoserine phosphatase